MTFLRKDEKQQFMLSGWRYRTAIGISSDLHTRFFGPKIGCVRMLVCTSDYAIIDFDAVKEYAEKLLPSRYPTAPERYEAALECAQYKLGLLRTELNRVIVEAIASRSVSRMDSRGPRMRVPSKRKQLLAAE